MRYVTYITEVSFKTLEGDLCVHEGWKTCEDCKPKELTLIGHYDLDSTVAIARGAHLGMYRGVPTKELLIQYFAVDHQGKMVPPKMMEHFSEEFVGPAEFIVSIENQHYPLSQEITNE